MIAMATHGRSGLARLVLGSVATGTLQRTSVPLLLVGPAALHLERSKPQLLSPAAVPAQENASMVMGAIIELQRGGQTCIAPVTIEVG